MMYVAVLSYAAPRAVVVVLGLPGDATHTVVGGTEKRQIILCPPTLQRAAAALTSARSLSASPKRHAHVLRAGR